MIEVKKSRKPVEARPPAGWFTQALSTLPEDTNATKPVPQPTSLAWQPVAEPVVPRRILPDLQHQTAQADVPRDIERTVPARANRRPSAPRKAASPLEQKLAQIDAERRRLLPQAKREALQAVQAAIADLNALGFEYRLVEH